MTWLRSPRWGLLCGVWAIVVIVATPVISVACWDQLSAGESLSSTIRNIGLVAAALIGLPLAFWRSTTADRQSNTALEQSTTAITQVGIASQGLLNERYQKGAEMLGGSVLTVRLGGIYALQRLAEERPDDYHIQIMNLFCAFVRQPTQSDIARDVRVAMDVQEAMNAIVLLSQDPRQIERLDLSGANLVGLNLEDANLSGAMLDGTYWGTASLAGVNLSDTSLNSASFFAGSFEMEIHRAKMRRADLTDAGLSDVRMVDVDLSDAKLDRANLSRATLTRTNMTGASLIGTVLNGARFYDVKGLDQRELYRAAPDLDKPPTFTGCLDSGTGEALVWPPKSAATGQGE